MFHSSADSGQIAVWAVGRADTVTPGLVVGLQPLNCVGIGSIPIKVASIFEGMSSLYTLVWGGDPSCDVYEIIFETVLSCYLNLLELI